MYNWRRGVCAPPSHTERPPLPLTTITSHPPPTELLIIGCGDTHEMLPPPLVEELRQKGIAVEAMGTVNACSTFNFLCSEGRNVAAALFPVQEVAGKWYERAAAHESLPSEGNTARPPAND